MFIDGRRVSSGSTITAEVCVVGAGAAGITLARSLSRAGLGVCLVESGGLDFDAETQGLYSGESVGRPYHALDATRLRYFGGSTNHWGGMCRPLDPIDFRHRAWISHSGWPFGREVLEPYYRQANEICGLGPFEYDPEHWEKRLATRRFPFDPAVVRTRPFQFNATRFGEVYREEIADSQTIRCLLNTNLVRITLDESGNAVTALEVATLAGNRFTVSGQAFVLAAGGIENPRLLLLSNDRHQRGIGNAHDLVGRFFMDHLDSSHSAGAFRFSDPRQPSELYRLRRIGHFDLASSLSLSEEVMEREGIGNFNTMLDVKLAGGSASLVTVMTELRIAHRLHHDIGHHVGMIISDFGSIVDEAMRNTIGMAVLGAVPQVVEVGLFNLIEQVPNPDSRVTLTEQRDALGLSRVRLDWRWTEQDKRTLRRAHEILAIELGRGNLGRFRMEMPEPPDQWPDPTGGVHHHMGTTRMHASERYGVVDPHCRVHGMANLYVAGSSVFPTGGYANPTLTIVALALRLSDHLKEALT